MTRLAGFVEDELVEVKQKGTWCRATILWPSTSGPLLGPRAVLPGWWVQLEGSGLRGGFDINHIRKLPIEKEIGRKLAAENIAMQRVLFGKNSRA